LRNRMLILKLGGSVVTHKDKPFTPHTDHIVRLAAEIAEADAQPLVVVHGGGSYGHPVATDYGIAEGYREPRQIVGFSKTHQAMVELNGIIVHEFLDAGVPAFAVSPSSFILTEGRRITGIDLQVVEGCIESGLVPVLFGDAVLDTLQGFAILSGDQLAVKLAIGLEAERVVLGSDVDGVFTDDPKLAVDARLIEELSLNSHAGEARIGDALDTDVTGGMLGKVVEAAEAVEAGIEVVLVNATVGGRVRAALMGENVIGTRLKR
jgi:isopentenyl phosphate kinase